jgi:hypothetical protein
MWIERNELVHHDGEVRDTLVIQDLDAQLRALQKEGSRCRDLFRDDRKFFRTPLWKLKKKTEQQKIRYIETATRLLDESRRATQQTLNAWRRGEDNTPSPEIARDDEATPEILVPAPANLQQTNLYSYFTEEAMDTDTAAPINGESSDVSASDSHLSSASDDDDSGFHSPLTEGIDSP